MDQMRSKSLTWPSELRRARERAGLSQLELASRARLPQAHVSRIENGVVDPRLSSLVRIARTVGLEPVLVPRRSLPAVLDVLQDFEGNAEGRRLSAIELLVGDGEGDRE